MFNKNKNNQAAYRLSPEEAKQLKEAMEHSTFNSDGSIDLDPKYPMPKGPEIEAIPNYDPRIKTGIKRSLVLNY